MIYLGNAAGTELQAQAVLEIVGPDLAANIDFYTALQFTIERRSPTFAVMRGHGVRIFLAENAQATVQARWASLRILVHDVDAVHAQASAAGITPVHPLAEQPWGLREFTLRDPSGFDLRFCQPRVTG